MAGDFTLDCTMLQNRTWEAPQDGMGCWKRGDTLLPAAKHALPPAFTPDAKFLAILVPRTRPAAHSQATTAPLAGSVEDLPMILEGHQVLLPHSVWHSSHTWG